MTSGYLYVLVHPSDTELYKVGQTSRTPEERLIEHNSNYGKYAGQIVKVTGQKWEIKTYIAVADRYWAEAVFWGATPLAYAPYLRGIEVQRMEWQSVQAGLEAASRAGMRPPAPPLPDYVYANTAWLRRRLEGRGITLLGYVRSTTSGRSNFRCASGHEWRATVGDVADGQGCPHCGIGRRTPEEMKKAVTTGILDLLIHPDKPGTIRIVVTPNTLEQSERERRWDGWTLHRYRTVEEPETAALLIWHLLDYPAPRNGDPAVVDLHRAEQALRDFNQQMQNALVPAEKVKQLAT